MSVLICIQTIWHSVSLPEIIFWKSKFLKTSTDDNKCMKNYQVCQELIWNLWNQLSQDSCTFHMIWSQILDSVYHLAILTRIFGFKEDNFLKENIVLLPMLHWQYKYMVCFINITFYEIILSNKRHYCHIICVLRGSFFQKCCMVAFESICIQIFTAWWIEGKGKSTSITDTSNWIHVFLKLHIFVEKLQQSSLNQKVSSMYSIPTSV